MQRCTVWTFAEQQPLVDLHQLKDAATKAASAVFDTRSSKAGSKFGVSQSSCFTVYYWAFTGLQRF